MFPEYPFESKYYLTTDNHRIHYVDEGVGPAIVMVHGNPTWSFFYRNVISALKDNFRIIAIDNIGCGLSDKPHQYEYRLANHIDNLGQLIDFLGLKNHALMVHDWGGAIGLGYGVQHPERIAAIVAMNTAAFRSARIPLRINICRIPVLGEMIVRLLNGFAWPATFMAVTKQLPAEIAAAYTAPYNSWDNRIAVARFVQDIPMRPGHPSYQSLVDIESGLQDLADRCIPMMLLWGGADFCFNKSFYDEWKKRFPYAECHYFEDGGHYILEDKKEEAALLVGNFFSKLKTPG